MKVQFDNDEIIIDLTTSEILNKKSLNPTLVKANYIIPVIKGVPKSFIYYRQYRINPYFLNCSCSEYRSNIKLFPLRDIRRICKHIFFILMRDHLERLDELTKLLLEHHFWDKITDVYEINFNTETIYISFSKTLKFLRIYKKNRNWKFYNFDLKTNKWENNLPPFKNPLDNKNLTTFLKNINQ